MTSTMIRTSILSLALCMLLLPLVGNAKMRIATIERAPFVYYEGDKLSGFSIDLWREIKKRSGISYSFVVKNAFSDMLDDVKNKKVDMAIANISITAEREKYMDFSHPMYDSGLHILTSYQGEHKTGLFSPAMLRIGGIFLLLILFHIGITTYGHIIQQIPTSGLLIAGRALGGGYLVITASHQLVHTSADLATLDHIAYLQETSIGVAKGTTMQRFLDNEGLSYTLYDDFSDSLKALENNEVEAIIGDAPVVKHYAAYAGAETVSLVGDIFEPDKLAIAIQERHPFLDKINTALLQIKEDGTYDLLIQDYFDEEL